MTQVAAVPASGATRGGGRYGGAATSARGTLLLAAVSAGLVALGWGLGWRGVDLPAQLFRVDQFRVHGFTLWDSQWYSGHWALDYSLGYPALGALVGVGLLAALSAALATAAFDRILVGAFGPAGRLGSAVFALSVIVETAIGQLAFFTGAAFALACVWALLAPRRRFVLAGVLALASTAISPLAGAFLALAMAAWCLAVALPRPVQPPRSPQPPRAAVVPFAAIGVLALLPIAVTTVLFPGQGPMPYPVIDWLWETVVALLVWMVAPRGMRTLRIGVALYALVLLGSV
ncbi:MAG: hypothetical protein J2P58_07640, partial [Acidimicrobiaceae bacterium]|nr:hypothetical protein [Acidimicrobiaceae bacterium]